MQSAPFFDDIVDHAVPTHTAWLETRDGMRIRAGFWSGGPDGTIFVFNGRTEFVEKYAETAEDFAKSGFSTVTFDWRGQGLSQRLTTTPDIGHVARFDDYQMDVDAVLDAAEAMDLPRPWFVLGHSMGGALALRTLHRQPQFDAAGFTGPMWGIVFPANLRAVAAALPPVMIAAGRGEWPIPGSPRHSYVLHEDFATNALTTDPARYRRLQRQSGHDSRLALGAPSYQWLHEALREMKDLRRLDPPSLPALTIVGSDEAITHKGAMQRAVSQWPGARLLEIEGARHEVLLERDPLRTQALTEIVTHFRKASS